MKKISACRSRWLICWSVVLALLSVVSCELPPATPVGVTPLPLGGVATEAKAGDAGPAVDQTATSAASVIQTALAQTPAIIALAAQETQTAQAAATSTQAAFAATQTASALPPTATSTTTPNLGATATQLANEQATAVAATITALAPTLTPTSDLNATAQEKATEAAAINATLTALAPTPTDTPTPDIGATRDADAHQMETAVAGTLTEVASHFTPTPIPTDTPEPPTDTPIPPPPTNTRAPKRPTNTPKPVQQRGAFRGSVNPICNGDRNMTWFEGMVYINGQPANGYKVVFKSYLVSGDQPATDPAISGPHAGYTDWPNGYYAHIVNDHFEKKHLEIWIIDNAGRAISDRVRWNSDGADGPCNKAVVNFAQ